MQFIIGLTRYNSDALGFIPQPDLQRRWISTGRYLLQRDSKNRPIGFLLHGPVRPDGHITINQTCLEYDHRRRQHATNLVRILSRRALRAGANRLLLRCGTDLDAIQFWLAIGAIPTLQSEGGKRRKRVIQHFGLALKVKTALQLRVYRAPTPLIDPKHLQPTLPLERLSG